MRAGILAIAGATLVAIGALLGRFVFPTADSPASAEREEGPADSGTDLVRSEGDGAGEGPARLAADWKGTIDRLESENRRLSARIAELEAAAGGEGEGPRPVVRGFRFGVPEKAPNFDAAEWAALAGHARALGPILLDLGNEIATKGKPSERTSAAIQEHNMPLAMFAISLAKELGGSGPNGAYTHPAVLANLARSILEAAGDPLSADQEALVRAAGEATVKALARQEEQPAALAVARTADEVDEKLRFVRALRDALSRSQDAILFPPETEGRVGLDLLSPGLVWIVSHDDAAGTDRAAVETRLITNFFDHAGIEVADLGAWQWAARDWLDAQPGALVPIAPRSQDALFPRLEVVQAAARAQAAVTERIIARGPFTEAQQASIRAIASVIRPQLQTAP